VLDLFASDTAKAENKISYPKIAANLDALTLDMKLSDNSSAHPVDVSLDELETCLQDTAHGYLANYRPTFAKALSQMRGNSSLLYSTRRR